MRASKNTDTGHELTIGTTTSNELTVGTIAGQESVLIQSAAILEQLKKRTIQLAIMQQPDHFYTEHITACHLIDTAIRDMALWSNRTWETKARQIRQVRHLGHLFILFQLGCKCNHLEIAGSHTVADV